jgi:biopolymer transport protein ExbD
VILTIAKDSRLFVDERPVEFERLVPVLKAVQSKDPGMILALNADKEAPFGVVMKVLDGLKEAGVKGSLTAFMERAK